MDSLIGDTKSGLEGGTSEKAKRHYAAYLASALHAQTIATRSPRSKTLDCTKLSISEYGQVFEIVERLSVERRTKGKGKYFTPAIKEWMYANRPRAARGLTNKEWKTFSNKVKRQYKKNCNDYKIMVLLSLGGRYKISAEQPERLKYRRK